jgi:hypothetical protein
MLLDTTVWWTRSCATQSPGSNLSDLNSDHQQTSRSVGHLATSARCDPGCRSYSSGSSRFNHQVSRMHTFMLRVAPPRPLFDPVCANLRVLWWSETVSPEGSCCFESVGPIWSGRQLECAGFRSVVKEGKMSRVGYSVYAYSSSYSLSFLFCGSASSFPSSVLLAIAW